MNCPIGVTGVMSPYPTVVSVTTAQYIPFGMLVICGLRSPSTAYITVPSITAESSTNSMNIKTFLALLFNAPISISPSITNFSTFNMRKIRSILSKRSTESACVAGKITLR